MGLLALIAALCLLLTNGWFHDQHIVGLVLLGVAVLYFVLAWDDTKPSGRFRA